MPKKEKMKFILPKDHEWRNQSLYTSRPRSSHIISIFDVNEFLRSSPNPVVASVFGDSETIQRVAVRRGYPVMKSPFLNVGDDIHDQSVRE